MTRYGMLIDLKSCIGCRACMTVCKANNNIPFGTHGGREYYRIWPEEVERGIYPYVIRNMTPLLCMHCEAPPCREACPVPGAIYRREDGIVLIDEKKCDGCESCVTACPYSALYFREDKGIVDKCTFCVDNIEQGGLPECVKTCPADALIFGNLEDTESRISQLIKEWNAKPLHPELSTKPSVYYTPHAARLRGIIVSRKTGQAVPGATVSLQSGDDTSSATTDSAGVFFFWNLKVGEFYSVRVTTEGFSSGKLKVNLDGEYTDLGNIPLAGLAE